MSIVNQIGGGSYDTNDYPYIMLDINTKEVYGRFSTLEKAHNNRLFHQILYPETNPMIFNENTKKFLDWRKKDLQRLEVLRKEYNKNQDISKLTKKIFNM